MTAPTAVFKCLPRADLLDGMRFWCPYYKKWHNHGKGEGYRIAHCTNPESPLKTHNYIIKPYTKTELRKIAKTIKAYLERRQ